MSKEAMKLALEALEKCDSALAEELSAWDIDPPLHHVLEASNACGPAITAIREALEEQPAQRKPLTDDEIDRIYTRYGGDMMNCARAIERAHDIKEQT